MSEDYTIQGAPWNKFFDLTVIKKFKIFYPSLRRHQDEGFIARYVDKASRITFSNEILYTYYVNNLQKQWDKYPVDYIEAVNGLFNERKKIFYFGIRTIKLHIKRCILNIYAIL